MGVRKAPRDLDVTASRTGGRVWLHVVNTNRTKPVRSSIAVEGMRIVSGKVHEIAVQPELEVWWRNAEEFAPVERRLSSRAPAKGSSWTFPAASVSAVELKIEEAPKRRG